MHVAEAEVHKTVSARREEQGTRRPAPGFRVLHASIAHLFDVHPLHGNRHDITVSFLAFGYLLYAASYVS